MQGKNAIVHRLTHYAIKVAIRRELVVFDRGLYPSLQRRHSSVLQYMEDCDFRDSVVILL